MTLSIKKAFKNIFADKEFWAKYAVLLILSFCLGFLNFTMMAKNYLLFVPAVAVAVMSSCLFNGYEIQYIKSLMNDKNAKMPEWNDNIWNFFLIGLKYFTAILLVGIVCSAIVIVLMMFAVIAAYILHYPILLKILSRTLFIIIEIVAIILTQGFIYLFIESNYEITSLFNFKKLFSYFGVTYFTSTAMCINLLVIIAIIATITTANIRYALLYLIPLIISPVFNLGMDNIRAQAYRAIKNNKKISFLSFILYTISAILIVAILIIAVVKTGAFNSK